jgi:hypothetical protein
MKTSKDKPNEKAPSLASGYLAWLVGEDKSWWRVGMIDSISDHAARISIVAGGGKLRLGDPFLLISSSGATQRRCDVQELNGNLVSVLFMQSM